MYSEESRLRSFDIWPNSDPVCARTLSASGFYATGNLFEVECNWCHCRITDWEFYENIEQRHCSLDPHCEFIINRDQCGNIPLSISSNELLPVSDQQELNVNDVPSNTKDHAALDLLIEKDRLATFVNWPNPNITPQSLAKAGFFYRNRSDEVQCAWCKGVVAKWEKDDNAFEEHRRFFPECPRVQLGPLIEIANDGIRDLGIQQISPPKNQKYASLQARLETYSNWPIPDIQRPEGLAQAGLYYEKVNDQVRCFHCNIGLKLWEKDDEPWFEHAKWYPMCEFVRLVKGANFIDEVQELTRTDKASANAIVTKKVEEAMLTEPVKLALEMGINKDTLRNKIQRKILETGCHYDTIDDLLEAVFDEEENINCDLENTPQTSNERRQTDALTPSIAINSDITCNRASTNDINLDVSTTAASTTAASIHEVNEEKPSQIVSSKLKINQIENVTPCSDRNGKMTLNRKFLEEENRKLKDARLCKVCLDEEVGVVYLPCGHLVTCVQCAPGVDQCPMCRTKIKGFVRTYLS